jgi:hypothetical protein
MFHDQGYLTGIVDTDLAILSELEPDDLASSQLTDKYIRDLVNNDMFLKFLENKYLMATALDFNQFYSDYNILRSSPTIYITTLLAKGRIKGHSEFFVIILSFIFNNNSI